MAQLGRGHLPIVEPGLGDLMKANGDRQTFTARIGDLGPCDVVYIALDVPTDDEGRSDVSGISALIEKVAAAMGDGAVMVVLSQVPPGFTRDLTGMTAERLYYQVETLVFGRAVERATRPERYIVGCADPDRPLDPAFAQVLEAMGCPVLTMRYESAELAKIAINVCLVASISAANTLAELCEKIDADWSEIVPALRLDHRIGEHAYLAPGLGIAGGNLERDVATVCQLADAHGSDSRFIRACLGNSRYRRDWALRTLHDHVLSRATNPLIGILGLAYKAYTNSTKNSPSLALITALTPYAVRVFDPVVPAEGAMHPRLQAADCALDACRGADVVLVMTPWPEFEDLALEAIARAMNGAIVIDPYGIFDRDACVAAGLDHFVLGRADEKRNRERTNVHATAP